MFSFDAYEGLLVQIEPSQKNRVQPVQEGFNIINLNAAQCEGSPCIANLA
jgi:hypothetical protein